MKNILSKLCIIVISMMFVSQNAMAQDHIDFISKEMCTCFTELQELDPEGVPMENLGKCFESVIEDNLEALETLYGEGVIGEDEESQNKLGVEIGRKLAQECPIFIDLFVKPAQEKNAKEIEFFNKGEEYLNSEEWDKALLAYNNAIAINPKKAEYFNQRGIVHFRKEDYFRSISDFYRAIEINPQYYLPFYNMAFSKYQLGNNFLALADVDSAIKVKPDYSESHNLKGLILVGLGKAEEARTSFVQAHRLDEKNSDFTYNIGYTYYEEDNYEKALEWFLKTSNLGENTVTVLGKIGNCYDILGNHPKGVEYHTKCIEINPGDYGVYYNRGLAYLNLESYKEAKIDFQKALELNVEDVDVYYNLAKAHFSLGDYENAMEMVETCLEMDTRNASFYDLRASIYEAQGKLDLAIEDYTVSISLYPDDCEIHMALGQLFTKTGNPQRAKTYFQNALDKGCDLAMDFLGESQD
jgi:tetratricopeptide (TPR) repeat protein